MSIGESMKLENQLCFYLYAAARETVKRYTPALDAMGLTYPQYVALLVLWEHREISVGDLGGKLRLESGTLTPLLKNLEKKGLVTRNRSESDERMVMITLTPAGLRLRDSARKIPGRIADALPFDEEETLLLRDLLSRLLTSDAPRARVKVRPAGAIPAEPPAAPEPVEPVPDPLPVAEEPELEEAGPDAPWSFFLREQPKP